MTKYRFRKKDWGLLQMLQFIEDLINSDNVFDQEDGFEYLKKWHDGQLLGM